MSNVKRTDGLKPGYSWTDQAGNFCTVRDNGTIDCKTINEEPSLTLQSEKDSCDFNLIYSKYVKTGIMSNWRTDEPKYGDFSNISDYHDAVLRAQQAEDSFMALPAALRARFSNDPGKLIDFLSDSNNRSEAIELGLVAKPISTPVPVPDEIAPSKEGA